MDNYFKYDRIIGATSPTYNELLEVMDHTTPKTINGIQDPVVISDLQNSDNVVELFFCKNWLESDTPYIRANTEMLPDPIINISKPYWTFQKNSWTRQYVDIDSLDFKQIIQEITQGQDLVDIGAGLYDIRNTLALMHHAKGHIGTDSGMMHLAMTIMDPNQIHVIHTGRQQHRIHVDGVISKGAHNHLYLK
jgi:hypothetical protein